MRIPIASITSLLLAACAGATAPPGERAAPPEARPAEPPAPGAAVVGEAAAPGAKPTAPVDVTIAARPLGGGEHEVTLTATPAVAATALELSLHGRREVVGPVAAGEARALTVRVRVPDGAGVDVAGGAAVPVGRHRRSRAAVIRLGAPPAAPPPVHVIVLPDGTEVAEVRP